MRFANVYFTLITIVFLSGCNSYRILGVFPLNLKSHFILFESLMKGLAERGHQVDVISLYPLKEPFKNYNDIANLQESFKIISKNRTIDIKEKKPRDVVYAVATKHGNRFCDLLGSDGIQKLIKNPPTNLPYDAVVVEAFTANCYMGLGYVLKAPVIAISSSNEYPWITEFTGNDDNPAYVPNAFQNVQGKMSFWERVQNVVDNHIKLFKFHTVTEEYQTNAMRKYLSPDIPNIREVEKNVALTLVNNDPIMFGVKPITPMLVQIAGLHVERNTETFTPDLKKWMDDSKDGVVYFSLGSMVLIESMTTDQLNAIYSAFKKIFPVRVLMKVNDESKLPPGLPANVKTLSWMPQIPILAHPNTKVFITHCGLGGSLEALYFGVPMIGMPLFGDQFRNCESFVTKNMMIAINFDEFSGETFDSALTSIIYNSTYKEKAVYYSRLFRDRPSSLMDKAGFWIEYVIRNGPVLRSPALDFNWWQLALLDVYMSILLLIIAILIILLIVLKLLFSAVIKLLTKKRCKQEIEKTE